MRAYLLNILMALSMLVCDSLCQDDICKYLRFANFADMGTLSMLIYTENLIIDDSKVSEYKRLCLTKVTHKLNLQINLMIGSRSVILDIANPDFASYLVIIYWDNSFAMTAYPDLEVDDVQFNRSHPYAPNVLWRFLPVPTGSLVSTRVMMASSSCLLCGFDEYSPNYTTMYTATNSLGYKNIMLNHTDGNEHGRIVKVSDKVVFNSRGIYSIVYLYNNQRYVMLTDRQSEGYFLPLSFVAICFIVTVTSRLIYMYHKKSKGRRHYRDEKSLKMKKAGNRVVVLRIGFVDVLRGICLTSLIFFNQGGGNYNFFSQSIWVGYTYADIPEYVIAWVMGFCIPFSYAHGREEYSSKIKQIGWIVLKGVIMIITGFICDKNTDSSTMVYLGFFQYMGIAFILMNLLYFAFPHSKKADEHYFNQRNVIIKFCIMTTPVIIHTAIVLFTSAPNCPRGYLGPGGKAENGANWNCTAGWYGHIDTQLFTKDHLRSPPACKYMFSCHPFSNYSVFAFVTFLYGVYLGVLSGQLFFQYKTFYQRVKFLVLQATLSLCVGAGLGMTSETLHTALIPPSKPLWSISYIMISNFLTCVMALFLHAAEDRVISFGWPFKAMGRNTPLIYFLAAMLSDRFPFSYRNNGSHLHLTTSNLVATIIWIYVAVQLHKYRFYFKY
jgi:heparan-alpha-glucosaminide N-acetyltransferase